MRGGDAFYFSQLGGKTGGGHNWISLPAKIPALPQRTREGLIG